MDHQHIFKLTTTYKASFKRKRSSDYVPKSLRDVTMEQYLEKKLVWSLYRDKHQKSYIDFVSFGPATKLNDQITADFMVELLNHNSSLFDIEYLPLEGDIFTLKYDYVMKPIRNKKRLPIYDEYMTFEFLNGMWKFEHMDDEKVYELIAEGIAEYSNNITI